MHYKILGRTGLNVSVAGLGCGGHSRLGQTYGNTAEQSADVVRAALDLGINFIDTAAAYGTEKIVGESGARPARQGHHLDQDGNRLLVGPQCETLHRRASSGTSRQELVAA